MNIHVKNIEKDKKRQYGCDFNFLREYKKLFSF